VLSDLLTVYIRVKKKQNKKIDRGGALGEKGGKENIFFGSKGRIGGNRKKERAEKKKRQENREKRKETPPTGRKKPVKGPV